MLTLGNILSLHGFEPSTATRLVRHQDSRWDIARLRRAGRDQFELYQTLQSRPVFEGVRQVVSFLGLPGSRAVFAGVYSVDGVEGPADFELPGSFLYQEMGARNCYRYAMTRDTRFSDLEQRLVIDWGGGTRSWVQHYRDGNRPVLELRPEGEVDRWPGFDDLLLSHGELVNVMSHPEAYREWHRWLASVSGVYLILDNRDGSQYVGSASGAEGLLGRWKQYAKTVHGGNQLLKEQAGKRPCFADDLRFAILQTMPPQATKAEVLAQEKRHKDKLGSRAHGLNGN